MLRPERSISVEQLRWRDTLNRYVKTGITPSSLRMQHAAAQAVPLSAYWACGRAAMLEVFGTLDPFKPQAYWRELSDAFGDRVTSVRIEDASHALFPEQPDRVTQAILPFLAQHATA